VLNRVLLVEDTRWH